MTAFHRLTKVGLYLLTGLLLISLPTSSFTLPAPSTITNDLQEFPLMPELLQRSGVSAENVQDVFVFHTPDGSLHKNFVGLPGKVLQQYVVQGNNYVLSQTEQGVFIGAQRVKDGNILWRMLLCPSPQVWWCASFSEKPQDWFYVTPDQRIYVLKLDSTYEVEMIDGRNGVPLWNFPIKDSPLDNPPHIGGDNHTLFISYRSLSQKPSDDGRYVLLLDAISGKIFKFLSLPIYSEQMRISNGVLYFDDQAPTDLYALRISDGKFLWRQHYAIEKAPLQWEIGDHLYLRFHSGLRVFSLLDGSTIIWHRESTGIGEIGIINNFLYDITAQDGRIGLTLFRQTDGKPLWQTTLTYHPLLIKPQGVTAVPIDTSLRDWNPLMVQFLPIASNILYIAIQGWPVQMFANREVIYAFKKTGQEIWCRTVTYTNSWQDCSQKQPKVSATDIKPFIGRWSGHAGTITITSDGHARYLTRLYCSAPECTIGDDTVVVNYDDVIAVNIQFNRLEVNTLYGVILADSSRIKQAIALSLQDGNRVLTSDGAMMCGMHAKPGSCGA